MANTAACCYDSLHEHVPYNAPAAGNGGFMTFWPVMARELRSEARRPMNHWLRVGVAGGVLAVFYLVTLRGHVSPSELGGALFASFHMLFFCAAWLLAPLLVSDTLSREKREGTLGLLLLTALSARGVVVGKILLHATRAGSLVLGVMPVLMLPFLAGGVSWQEGVLSIGINLGALLSALAAGVLASALSRRYWDAAMNAVGMSLCFTLIFCSVHAWLFTAQVNGAIYNTGRASNVAAVGFLLSFGPEGWWAQTLTRLGPAAQARWALVGLELLGLGVLLMYLSVWVAGLVLRHSVLDEPVASRRTWWFQTFLQPRYGRGMLQRSMERNLSRNPIAWMQENNLRGRAAKWGWFAIGVAIEPVLLSQVSEGEISFRTFWNLQFWLGVFLLAAMAFVSVNSFRAERESGTLELLLVTPLREGQILLGRLSGIWLQFLPAGLLLLLLWMGAWWMAWPTRWRNAPDQFLWLFPVGYFSVPVVGLFFALREKSFARALAATFFFAFGVTYMVSFFPAWYLPRYYLPLHPALSCLGAASQVIAGVACGRGLLVNLRQRSFAFYSGHR